MIRYKTNAGSFAKQIDAEIAAMGEMLDGVARGIAVTAYGVVLEETPQWSGNAAANWNFSLGSPDESVDHTFKHDLEHSTAPHALRYSMEAKSKGDPEAIQYAVQKNAGKESNVSFGSPVYITNNATNLSGESYIHMLELNPNNFLRPENEPGHMTFTAMDRLGRLINISDKTAALLGTMTISGLAGGRTQLGLF